MALYPETLEVTGARWNMSSRSILLVEDDRQVVRSVERLLKRQGYRVAWVTSALEAARLTECFDVGLFDIDLGQDDGVQVAARMRSEGRVQRVVFLTGTADQAQLVRAKKLGPIVSKREPSSQLFEVLGQVLGEIETVPPRSGFQSNSDVEPGDSNGGVNQPA